jgi:hypothetical protein
MDESGLPTYEAAMRLEAQGYVWAQSSLRLLFLSCEKMWMQRGEKCQ